jgi:hypothetical protein
MNMLHVHVTCTCYMYMLHVHVTCYMYHVHVTCTMYMLHVRITNYMLQEILSFLRKTLHFEQKTKEIFNFFEDIEIFWPKT